MSDRNPEQSSPSMLKIDPEFRAYIPALADDERKAPTSRQHARDQRRLLIGQQYNEARKAASLDAGKVVYFLGAGPFVKIGHARMLISRRIKELQTGCPFTIELLAWLPGGQEREQPLHRRFAHLHERGEWFRSEPDLLSYIADINAGRVQ